MDHPWNEGYKARYECKRRGDNPYSKEKGWPGKCEEWDRGWFFADSEIRTA